MSDREARVSRIPNCDFCKEEGKNTPAYADARTWWGPWANVCKVHFQKGGCSLGLGKGQVFVKV
jgi:hypothetical protein